MAWRLQACRSANARRFREKPERGGFEPPVHSRAHWFSKPAPSAARAPLQSQAGGPKGLDRPPSPQRIGRGPPRHLPAAKRTRQERRSLPDSTVARQPPLDRSMIRGCIPFWAANPRPPVCRSCDSAAERRKVCSPRLPPHPYPHFDGVRGGLPMKYPACARTGCQSVNRDRRSTMKGIVCAANVWALANFGGADLGDQRRSKDSCNWRA